jgi:hypothetical protein
LKVPETSLYAIAACGFPFASSWTSSAHEESWRPIFTDMDLEKVAAKHSAGLGWNASYIYIMAWRA